MTFMGQQTTLNGAGKNPSTSSVSQCIVFHYPTFYVLGEEVFSHESTDP